jgi:hypothetical protein
MTENRAFFARLKSPQEPRGASFRVGTAPQVISNQKLRHTSA